jgi:gliding motility-associated lipoprotein GldH
MAEGGTKGDREEMKERINWLAALLLITLTTLLITSCRERALYSEIQQVTGAEWSRYNRLIFKADITDTLTACDILLTLRTNADYPFRNIFLFITTTSPEGYSVKDTLEYYLADEKGNWFGRGLGDVNDLSVKYRSNIIFPESGTYEFRIDQGMRTDNLKGVMDVGLRIVPGTR